MEKNLNHLKQKLSLEFIKKDVKNILFSSFLENTFYLIISIVFAFLVSIVPNFSDESSIAKIAVYGFMIFMYLIIVFAFALFGFKTIKNLKIMINLKKGKFIIETDTLIDAQKIKYIGKIGPFSKLYSLRFEKFPSFEIGWEAYYKWSEMYNMKPQSLYNSSLPGDKFYIIMLCNNSPTIIYNKKYFYIPTKTEDGSLK